MFNEHQIGLSTIEHTSVNYRLSPTAEENLKPKNNGPQPKNNGLPPKNNGANATSIAHLVVDPTLHCCHHVTIPDGYFLSFRIH